MAAGLSPRSASTIADQTSETMSTIASSEYTAASTVLGRRAKQMSWRSYALVAPGEKPMDFSKPQYSGRMSILSFSFSLAKVHNTRQVRCFFFLCYISSFV
jgi:hypothetical protein